MQVLQARDRLEALALIASRAFDAVLIDIRMPRLDWLATRLLRELELSRLLEVLAFTAMA